MSTIVFIAHRLPSDLLLCLQPTRAVVYAYRSSRFAKDAPVESSIHCADSCGTRRKHSSLSFVVDRDSQRWFECDALPYRGRKRHTS